MNEVINIRGDPGQGDPDSVSFTTHAVRCGLREEQGVEPGKAPCTQNSTPQWKAVEVKTGSELNQRAFRCGAPHQTAAEAETMEGRFDF